MPKVEKYVPAAREQAFLDTVESPRYDRRNVNGLKPFMDERVALVMAVPLFFFLRVKESGDSESLKV